VIVAALAVPEKATTISNAKPTPEENKCFFISFTSVEIGLELS
jgi:hypothetical protein